MKTLKLFFSVIIISFLFYSCSDNDNINVNSSNEMQMDNDFISSYNCTLTVYQQTNFFAYESDESVPVNVIVGQYWGNWSTTGHWQDWVGFYTNPFSWYDDAGYYETVGWAVSHNFNWTNGTCPYDVGLFESDAGYNGAISACPGSSGNITNWQYPNLQFNHAYSMRVGIQYFLDDNISKSGR